MVSAAVRKNACGAKTVLQGATRSSCAQQRAPRRKLPVSFHAYVTPGRGRSTGLLSCMCRVGPRPIHPRCRSLTPNPFLHISWTLPCKLLPRGELPQPRTTILNFAPNSSLNSDRHPDSQKNPIGRESGQLEKAPSARNTQMSSARPLTHV